MDWLFKDLDNAWEGVVSSALILAMMIAAVKIAGLRTFSKMTSFDFAVTISLGSILGATATGSVTVLQGAIALSALVVLQALFALAMRKSDLAAKCLGNSPLLLMDGPEVLHDNLRYARMAEAELTAKLREANVLHRKQVLAVILESTGDVSVLHSDDPEAVVEDWLLEKVRRTP